MRSALLLIAQTFRGSPAHASLLIEVLVAAGADLEVHGPCGKTPLMFCMRRFFHASNFSKGLILSFLKSGARVDCADSRGLTTFHWLAMAMGTHCVFDCSLVDRLVRQHKADPNAKDLNGNTAAHICCERGYHHVVQNSLCGLVDMGIRNQDGHTAADLLEARLHSVLRGDAVELVGFRDSAPRVIRRLRQEEQRGY